ncbi:hypothetical protein ACFY03_31675 [Micromonospora chersina]|uniref:hypothetical protein n=1 Tax=Micromonospora chersina TaxID=47854 RepID=UPI00369E8E13
MAAALIAVPVAVLAPSAAQAVEPGAGWSIVRSSCTSQFEGERLRWYGGVKNMSWPQAYRPEGDGYECVWTYKATDGNEFDYYAVVATSNWRYDGDSGARDYPAYMWHEIQSNVPTSGNVLKTTESYTSHNNCLPVSFGLSLGPFSIGTKMDVCDSHSVVRSVNERDRASWYSSTTGGLEEVETAFMEKVPRGVTPTFDIYFAVPQYSRTWNDNTGLWTSTAHLAWNHFTHTTSGSGGGGSPSPGGPSDPDETNPPSGGNSQTPNLIVMQANNGLLFARENNGTWRDLQLGVMRGTSPATSNGQIAFQANTGFLFTRSAGGTISDTRYGMMAGTNPAISGGQIAFQANNTLLHTRNMNTGQTTDLALGMMAGSSPSIAGDTSSWRIAFQANDGFLYYRDSNGSTVNTGYGMMRGTSPSITKLSNGTYVIAFQANNGLLYTYSNGNATCLYLGMMTDTSPAISSLDNSWTIASQANTGFLLTRNSAGSTVDTRYGMMAHTSPSARGNRIVFQANTGFLFYRDGNLGAVDTRYGMMAGTNPGI